MLQELSKSAHAFHKIYNGSTVVVHSPPLATLDGHRHKLESDIGELARLGVNVEVVFGEDALDQATQDARRNIEHVIVLDEPAHMVVCSKGIAPLASTHTLDRVARGDHVALQSSREMRARLPRLAEITRRIGRSVITTCTGLRDELERWRGSGTLCFVPEQCDFSGATQSEQDIFYAVYAEFVASGAFRPRDEQEFAQLQAYHWILRARSSPLGGASLVPIADGWCELSALWSGYLGGSEVGRLILEKLIALMQEKEIRSFALTKSVKVGAIFEQAGFTPLGHVSDLQAAHEMPILKQYDTSARDPFVFTFDARRRMPHRRLEFRR